MTKTTNPISQLLAAAERGDVNAQFDLATRYREAAGVPKDLGESLKWYRKAAEAGHPEAMHDLGYMLCEGLGCKVDSAEGILWHERAAQAGAPKACYDLGLRYRLGLGADIDFERAMSWMVEAVRQDPGHSEAICELGTMHRFGQGTSRNLEAAAVFHVIAARGGDVAAMGSISDYLDELQDIALAGNATASHCLAQIYNRGFGVERSMPITWTWAKWAKEHCPPSDDVDEAAEIEEAYAFYNECLPADDRTEGERVLKALIAAGRKTDTPTKSQNKRKGVKT